MPLIDWVRLQLPPPPARLLEVGCGDGALARGLAADGYDLLAIDPVAPEGPIFRRTTLEELDVGETFDAVVSSRTLHHVHDLAAGLDKIATLAPLLVLDEFAWDRLDEATARWYEEQRLEADAPPVSEWEERHGDLHGFATLREGLARRFTERHFAWSPYLYRYFHRPELEPIEAALIEAGAIRALGFRYVGESRLD